MSKPKEKQKADAAQYQVTLRTPAHKPLIAQVIDDKLYPLVLSWNRILSSNSGWEAGEQAWRTQGHAAIMELSRAGEVGRKQAESFIKAAAVSGIVEVEMEWTSQPEEIGWAARLFPWESLLALATKEEREGIGKKDFVVVRYLRRPATGSPGQFNNELDFFVTDEVISKGIDYQTELAAVSAALGIPTQLEYHRIKTLENLEAQVRKALPRVVHLVLESVDNEASISGTEKTNDKKAALTQQMAHATASHGPELVAFSSCYTGRRLAPHAVGAGAEAAIGFHDEVTDASLAVFFGAFYDRWHSTSDPRNVLEAVRAGLRANLDQDSPGDLGMVTLWSSRSLLPHGKPPKVVSPPAPTNTIVPIPSSDWVKALPVICDLEEELNYSLLFHSRGGLFKAFSVTKIRPGAIPPVEIRVKLDTGLDRPTECHFFAPLKDHAFDQKDLAASVTLPLGSQLLRQRGETMLGTVEVEILCEQRQIFHRLQSIKLLPCDEWRDKKESGRMLLPAFVFPRDPAVREIISTSEPFLRTLCDQAQAGFDGYQGSFHSDVTKAVHLQVQAIWAALQHSIRLTYVNPPPTYSLASQRLRVPEEILRARRGTCIELALLLASCLEHVGIYPVLFLTSGHAFAGYWTHDSRRDAFFKSLKKLLKHAQKGEAMELSRTGGTSARREVHEVWMLAEPFHLRAILSEIADGHLVALETTFMPLMRPFAEAIRESYGLLQRLHSYTDPETGELRHEFDGMLDVQCAREKGVTPLPIITQGIMA